MEDGKTVEEYASSVASGDKCRGYFDIVNCKKFTAEMFAKKYCNKHNITPIKRSWFCRDWDQNVYEVVDANNVEYRFFISRATCSEDGELLSTSYGAYIGIRKEREIKFIEITNINDL